MKSILRTLVSLILCASLAAAPTAPVVVNPNTSVLISPTAAALLAANPTLGGITSITGTANEITVAGTTTPTLSLPAALTFTAKTIAGGTFTGGAFNGTLGATTPSTIAGTTGVFSGPLNTTGNFSDIYTTGADATIYTEGTDATINTEGATAHIYTAGANAFIRSRSTFKLFDGTFTTTLSHAPTADRAIAFPNAAGTLALVSGDLGTPSAIVLTNASGTLPAGVTIPLGTVTLTGTLPDARNTVSNSTTTTMSALGTIGGLTTVTGTGAMSFTGGAGNMTITSGTGNSRTLTLRTTTSGGTATDALTIGADQNSTFSGAVTATSPSVANFGSNSAGMIVTGAGQYHGIALNATKSDNTGQSSLLFAKKSVIQYQFGCDLSGNGTQDFYIYDQVGGIARLYFATTQARLASAMSFGFSSSLGAGNALDTAISRDAAGVIAFGTGAAGSLTGSWKATNGTLSGTLAVTGSSVLTGNLTSNGALITTPENLAPALDAGAAVGVTTLTSTIAVNGTNAVTLANGTNGQIKTIVCTAVTAAGTATVTPTTCSGFTTVAFTAAGQSVTLQYFSTGGWVILSVRNATIAALGDTQRHRCTGEAFALCV